MEVNTDVGFDGADCCSGSSGVVIHDHFGMLMVIAKRWLDDVLDALTAEAMAANQGLTSSVEHYTVVWAQFLLGDTHFLPGLCMFSRGLT